MPGEALPKGQPGKAAWARACSRPPQTRSTEHCFTTSTTKRKAKSSSFATEPPPFSFLSALSSKMSSAATASTGCTSVTSRTEMPNFQPSAEKSFWSPRTMEYGPRFTIHVVLARNISRATSSGSSTPPTCARSATANLSADVVVTLCRFSVSDRMAHMSARAVSARIMTLFLMKRCATIVDIEPQGLRSISRGESEEKESASAWWSMRPTIRCLRSGLLRSDGTICFSSLWSTRQTFRSLPVASGLPHPGQSSKSAGSSIFATSFRT
mmetsp:Transcript_23704/g.74581  ORF Transcript_23704/g.74581 Transcript_23704/m.74581 type:complete len:268 (-) Transcript_23704:566-1369(-)